jgi:hypothetical protein
MPDWINCPQCGLKHRRRDDGLCPKCLNAVGEPAEPLSSETGSPLAGEPAGEASDGLKLAPERRDGVTLGSRLAGAVLLVNAALSIAEIAVMAGRSGERGPNPVTGLVVDVIVGGALLLGKPKARQIGLVRIALGAIIFGGLFLSKGEHLAAGMQIVFSASLALLIAGNPGTTRIALAVVMAAVCFLLEGVGLTAIATGTNPIAAAILRSAGGDPAAGELRGDKFDYCVQVPPKDWYLRTAAAARKTNPLSDRWLMRPDHDAHVMIMGEQVKDGLVIDQARYEDVLMMEAQTRLTDFHLIGRDPLVGGTALHYTGKANSVDLEYYRGAFADGNRAYQVVAFASPRQFARMREELSGIVRSFRPRCATAK